jgi:hypothetical protein
LWRVVDAGAELFNVFGDLIECNIKLYRVAPLFPEQFLTQKQEDSGSGSHVMTARRNELGMTQLVKRAPPLIPQQVCGIINADHSQNSL